MVETPSLVNISTKLQRGAKLAHDAPELAFTTLAHHLDLGGCAACGGNASGSYLRGGFRPLFVWLPGFRLARRSAHQALEALRDGMMGMGGGWIASYR